MTELHRSLAMNVKSLRTKLGWSQAELAERAGLSVSYVGDIEAGVKWPAAVKVESLAKAFKIKPYQLFLDPQDFLNYQAFLERRDFIEEMGEKLYQYWEKRGR